MYSSIEQILFALNNQGEVMDSTRETIIFTFHYQKSEIGFQEKILQFAESLFEFLNYPIAKILYRPEHDIEKLRTLQCLSNYNEKKESLLKLHNPKIVGIHTKHDKDFDYSPLAVQNTTPSRGPEHFGDVPGTLIILLKKNIPHSENAIDFIVTQALKFLKGGDIAYGGIHRMSTPIAAVFYAIGVGSNLASQDENKRAQTWLSKGRIKKNQHCLREILWGNIININFLGMNALKDQLVSSLAEEGIPHNVIGNEFLFFHCSSNIFGETPFTSDYEHFKNKIYKLYKEYHIPIVITCDDK